MLYCGLYSISELKAAEEKKRREIEKASNKSAISLKNLDPSLISALRDYNPSNPF